MATLCVVKNVTYAACLALTRLFFARRSRVRHDVTKSVQQACILAGRAPYTTQIYSSQTLSLTDDAPLSMTLRFSRWSVLVFALSLLPLAGSHLVPTSTAQEGTAGDPPTDRAPLVVDDFEDDPTGAFPEGWVFVTRDRDVKSYAEARSEGESVSVRQEDGNRFVRLITRNDVARYTRRNGPHFDWNVEERPYLQWRWRAVELPEGASERGENDTGAALYVTFGTDWLGRPKSLKYTYSSALSVGETVDFGTLKVIVVDSRPDSGTGTWQTVVRNVADDYRRLFGEEPPDRPAGITIWSDSDTTGDTARADFDDVTLLPFPPDDSHSTPGR